MILRVVRRIQHDEEETFQEGHYGLYARIEFQKTLFDVTIVLLIS